MDVDKILKFENLDEDFKNMLEDIKPKFCEKRQKIFNKELPQAKVLRHKPHYSLFYDDDSIDLQANFMQMTSKPLITLLKIKDPEL